jgi:hypothetical protein
MEEANINLARAALALNCGQANLQVVSYTFKTIKIEQYVDCSLRKKNLDF